MIYKRSADADRFLASPPRDLRACLIYGRDRSGIRERSRNLATRFTDTPDDPFNTASITEADLEKDPARVADELSAISMLGGKRIVRMQVSGERTAADRAAAEALASHVDGRFNPEALLLIEAGALSPSSPLRKAAETLPGPVAVLPVYEDEATDWARLARETLAADQLRLTPEALTLLGSRLPKDRGVARQELERLALFLGPGSGLTATVETLEPFFGVEAEASLADAALEAFGGGIEAALSHLRRAFAEGESGPTAVRVAGGHLQRLRRVGFLIRNGQAYPSALKSSGVFWKQEREFTRQQRAWTDDALTALQTAIVAADVGCKTANAPDTLLAERLYLTIASAARRAGL